MGISKKAKQIKSKWKPSVVSSLVGMIILHIRNSKFNIKLIVF